MVQAGVGICRAARLFEMGQRWLGLLASLCHTPGLRRFLPHTLASIAQLRKEADAATAPETFWLAVFENGDRYVYRESGFVDIKTFAELIAKRAKCVAGQRAVRVLQTGLELDPAGAREDAFRVLVRKVEPYLTLEKSRRHTAVFERNFGAVRFFCDIALKRRGAPGGW
jgi:hypothetical protein